MAAALAVTAIDLRPASAAPKAPDIRAAQDVGTLDVSAQRRHYRGHRYYRGHGGNAAGAAAALGVFGAVAGIAAANSYRRHYYEPYGYGGPGYGYYGAPAYGGYYGGPAYYRRW
jgi:hypothetical protein